MPFELSQKKKKISIEVEKVAPEVSETASPTEQVDKEGVSV